MHFMAQRVSTPIAYQTSGGMALASAGASLLAAVQQFRKSSDLSATWTGTSAQAHEQRVAKLIDAASRVAQAIARAQTITAPGATRMQALKTQNDATVASAIAGRFVVLPSGQVVPGPEHYASAVGPHAAAIMKMYWTIAKLYTGQVNTNLAASTATDGQVAAQLAAVAIEFFADLLAKKNSGSGANPALAMPPGGGLPNGSAPLDPFTIPPEPAPILDPNTGGTSLAGAGGLGGAGSFPGGGLPPSIGGAGLTGGGLGGIGGGGIGGGGGLPGGGAAGVGGAGMVGGVPIGGAAMAGGAAAAGRGGGMVGGPTAGGAAAAGRGGGMVGGPMVGGGAMAGGASGGGAAGGTAAGRGGAGGGTGAGARGGGVTPMAGMGYGTGQNEEHASSDTWLREDGNPWDPDEAPGSVLT